MDADAREGQVYCCRQCGVRARNRRNRPTPEPRAKRLPVCQHCGDKFTPRTLSQKYCDDECAHGAALRKQRGRNRQRDTTAGPLPARTPQPQRTVPRARTLADTPDTPAITAERGDYLTGGAAATMQATSGGRIGVV
jgi:hypothetical protein